MLDLKNCPFCGGKATLYPPYGALGAWISCAGCGLEGPTETGVTAAEAIAAWNRRALQAVDPEPAVAVRPLEWHKSQMPSWNDDWHTTTPIIYTVRCADENGWKWSFHGGQGYERSPEAAKAAAESDYASRIRSALVATPPVSRKEQLEKRAAELVADMDAKGIKTLGDVARYCDHAEATPPAEPVVEALEIARGYILRSNNHWKDDDLAKINAALAAKGGRS